MRGIPRSASAKIRCLRLWLKQTGIQDVKTLTAPYLATGKTRNGDAVT